MTCEHWIQGAGFAKATLYAACPWCEIGKLRALLRSVQINAVVPDELMADIEHAIGAVPQSAEQK